MDEVERFGTMLGLMASYGTTTIQAAVQAAREGRASPRQQKIVAQVLDVSAGQKPTY